MLSDSSAVQEKAVLVRTAGTHPEYALLGLRATEFERVFKGDSEISMHSGARTVHHQGDGSVTDSIQGQKGRNAVCFPWMKVSGCKHRKFSKVLTVRKHGECKRTNCRFSHPDAHGRGKEFQAVQGSTNFHEHNNGNEEFKDRAEDMETMQFEGPLIDL